MGRAKGRRVSAQSPLGASLVGSPRQERALAAAAAGPREPFPIAQRQPSPLGGMGDAVCSSADAELFSYERFYPRAAAANARSCPGPPIRDAANAALGATRRDIVAVIVAVRMHSGATLHPGYEADRVRCRGL